MICGAFVRHAIWMGESERPKMCRDSNLRKLVKRAPGTPAMPTTRGIVANARVRQVLDTIGRVSS
jgi:hypothetical protein